MKPLIEGCHGFWVLDWKHRCIFDYFKFSTTGSKNYTAPRNQGDFTANVCGYGYRCFLLVGLWSTLWAIPPYYMQFDNPCALLTILIFKLREASHQN